MAGFGDGVTQRSLLGRPLLTASADGEPGEGRRSRPPGRGLAWRRRELAATSGEFAGLVAMVTLAARFRRNL